MRERARQLLLNMAHATEELQDFLTSTKKETGDALKLEAQLLADDPNQSAFVQEFCRGVGRGVQGHRSGLSMGEGIDREIERLEREVENDDESQK